MATTLLKIAADTQLSLAAAVTVGQTTATLSAATDGDGTALPSGKYGFTVDGDTSAKEYIVCDLVGTALTNVQNITRQGVTSTGFANYHRVGATVTITDWAILSRMLNNLNGTTGFDSGANLGYDGAPAGLTGNQFATVNYVLSVVNGGAVSFDQQVLTNQTAGEGLTIRDHVYLKASDAKWYKVDADDTTTFQGVVRGLALSTVSANDSVSVSISGPTGGFTGLTAGSKYYASGTAGAITDTIPTAPTYETLVGVALNTTTLLLDLLPNTNQFAGTLGNPSSTNQFLTEENEYSAIIDQSQATQNSSTTLGEADSTTLRNKIAQSFVAGRIKLRGVELYKSADTGTFTGTVTVALQADSAGTPSGSNLASVTITNAQWLNLSAGTFQVPFSSGYSAVIGTTYWIVVSTSTADTSNHPNLGINTAGGYANGIFRYNNTTDGWVTVSGQDIYFKTINSSANQIPVADSTGLVPFGVLPYGLSALDTTSTAVSSSSTETTVYTKKLEAGFFTTNSGVKITSLFSLNYTSDGTGETKTIRIKLNGTTIATLTTGELDDIDNIQGIVSAVILNNNSLSSQKFIATLAGIGDAFGVVAGTAQKTGGAVGTYAVSTSSVDTSGLVVLTITVQNSKNQADSIITSRYMLVERIG